MIRWMFLSLAACGTVDPDPSAEGTTPPATWSIDLATGDGALLGVWGTSPTNVWAVGGGRDHAIVLHGDGQTWTRADATAPALLYSIYGFSDADIYAVGEAGVVLHYDGATWTRIESGTTLPLFGLWGASGDDVWIVGGNLTGPAVVLRGSHGAFAPVALPAELAQDVLFKAHGFAANDVVMVGNSGVIRWDGTSWYRDDVPTTEPLFSTWGRGAADMFAVGGRDVAEILHSDGTRWTQLYALPTGVGLHGVFTSAGAPTIAVGASSFVFEVAPTGALSQPRLPDLGASTYLHGIWGDGAGTTYVVGSDYPYSTTGTILRRQ